MNKEILIEELKLFSLGSDGIGSWLMPDTDDEIFLRLLDIKKNPLKKVQLNQLLVMGHEAPVSDGFFKYYWCDTPSKHPYDVKKVQGLPDHEVDASSITSIEEFKWGMTRLFIDSLLYWGNVRTGYRELRNKSYDELCKMFSSRRFQTEYIVERGPCLDLEVIAKDKRYLISEMACKSYDAKDDVEENLKELLLAAFKDFRKNNTGTVKIGELLSGEYMERDHKARQVELTFSADEMIDLVVDSEAEIEDKFSAVYGDFSKSREAALLNTKRYLSMVSDLDVYVATSMRSRQDFRDMADKTESIFDHSCLKDLEIRYFDPTLSAANGHENKGLIECLMVKCSKVLVYCAGEKESYGKDAEAAMALSLGKPVIFLCDHQQRARFYKEVHPLSRLIHFETGVAMGAIITDKEEEVSILIERIFQNKMQYNLEHDGNGYLRLKERLTDSIIRLQTNDQLLNETFWNHYHG
jgi:hypothetical protein